MGRVWTKPSHGYVKVNVKGGVSKRFTVASVGAIVRNENGEWLKGLAGCIGLTSPILAAVWGIFYGLDLAWRFGKKVILESEEEDAVDLVRGTLVSTDLIYVEPVVRLINEVIANNKMKWGRNFRIKYSVINKQQNLPTRLLADAGAKLKGKEFEELDLPPREITERIRTEADRNLLDDLCKTSNGSSF